MNVIELNTLKLRKLLLVFSLVLGFANLNAQQIFCGSITVSLDPANCEATISPGDLVENPGDFPPGLPGFLVELFYDQAMTMPVPTSPDLTAADIGLFIVARVTNVLGDGNSCWTTIGPVSDYSVPDLTCEGPYEVLCTDDLTPTTTPELGRPLGFPVPGGVIVIDNLDGTYTLQNFDACGDATLTYTDVETAGNCMTGPLKTIVRTWTVTDENGNTATCSETISVLIPNPALILFPLPVNLECNNITPPNTTPDSTGYPTLNGVDITENYNVCGLKSFKEDMVMNGFCGGETIINRTWTIFNCMGMPVAGPMLQQIKILDTTAPVIECPTDTLTIGALDLGCTASTTLPVLNVTENCSNYGTVTTATNGTITGNVISGLPLGYTTVTVIVTDECDNADTCSYVINVVDVTPPIANCESLHTVGISGNPSYYNAIDFDDGSLDECSDITYEVRRLANPNCTAPEGQATAFGPTVPFYCCDVGDTIQVILRVTNEAGLSNTCPSFVIVYDNVAPTHTSCPADITVACTVDIDDYTNTNGSPIFSDNCGIDTIVITNDSTLISCGSGTVLRKWVATDLSGNQDSCEQTITLQNSNPFTITDTKCWSDPIGPGHSLTDGVEWPCSLMTLTTCGASLHPDSLIAMGVNPNNAKPQLFPNSCEVGSVEAVYSDGPNLNGSGACRKFLRTWSVYNWCDEDPTTPVGTYIQVIMVLGSAAPQVTCGDVVTVQVPAVTVLEISPTDDCTPAANLTVSYVITLDFATTPVIHDQGTGTVATQALPAGNHRIEWTITDDCGQETDCSTTFLVLPQAPPSATVSGGIENEEGDEVEHVMVEVSGDMSEASETTESGAFSFELPTESNYAITPGRDDNPLNGVSTFDLVKISQHILETQLLSSPYKMIAADVNRSGSVTTVDLVELRKLILFIETEFANNTSWRFVDADFVFPNPANPFQTSFPEVYTINDLEDNMQADFVGIKVGDVNCSAAANDFAGSSDDRNAGKDLMFYVDDQSLNAGETYTIDFNIDNVSNLQGYQFTLAFDQGALYFENLTPGTLEGITENNFGLSLLDKGVITTSWNTAGMLNTQKGTSFSVTFTALVDTKLSEVININSRYTKAQAYINNESTDVSLAFETENGIALDHFQLFQNRPNPFKGETVISFNLPEENAGTLTIYDLSGRVIKVVRGNFTEGYNEVGISSTDLTGHGVFYYQLEVADYFATRRMVLLK